VAPASFLFISWTTVVISESFTCAELSVGSYLSVKLNVALGSSDIRAYMACWYPLGIISIKFMSLSVMYCFALRLASTRWTVTP